VDQVKFVKQWLLRQEVTEEPPKIVEIKKKKLGAETIKDPCSLSVAPVGPAQLKLLKKTIRFTGRYRVKPEFPGGMAKF
jgi:protein TonB